MKTSLFRLALISLFLISSTATAADVGVRIRFGLNDKEPETWDGTVNVKPGKVAMISGWRFEQTDQANGTEGWVASTRPAADNRTGAQKAAAKAKAAEQKGTDGQPKAKGKKGGAAAKAKAKAGATGGNLADNGVLISLTDVTEDSVVSIKTEQGEFNFKLSDIPYGKYIEKLEGGVEIERTGASRQVTSDRKTDHDYPAAAVAKDGTAYITYQCFTPGIDRDERARAWGSEPTDLGFLTKAPGGDQLVVRVVKSGVPGEEIAVTENGCDIYKNAVAVAGDGTAWIFWSQNANYKPFPDNAKIANFDIWARPLSGGKLGTAVKISSSDDNDVWPVAATDSAGKVWVAWQGARNRAFKIHTRHQDGNSWSKEETVSTQSRNCWAPAIAASTSGNVAIAWDTYEKGDYDVWVREFDKTGKAGEARPVANTPDYEARPALAYDKQNSLWVAYEESGPSWGKDWSGQAPFENRDGIALYKDRQIGLAILKDGKWHDTSTLLANSLPGADPRRRRGTEAAAARPATGPLADADEGAVLRANVHNNIARIVADNAGRIWVLARARQNDFRSQIGSVWMTYASYFEGNQWTGPVLVPHSDNLLYNSPAATPLPDGGLLIAHSSDHRQDRHVSQRGANALGILAGQDPFDNDIFVSRLEIKGEVKPAALVAAKVVPNPSAQASAATTKERSELERIRAYRANIGGKNLQIVRGDFHRHTEISGDGGNDGPLEDMWRYAIDVASHDWLGNSDHDNGGHREYPWWLTQKTTDAFRLPGAFDPPYAYERSVTYPEGHRNVIFTRRGVRTLPRLPRTDRDNVVHAPDTQMLYKYLKQFDGVCASHTSATGMGTDWRDNDPSVEPMVEIYQGCRMNYERPGAPRSPNADFSLGGYEPKGFINLALLKGYKFSFESSSDHGSTHISYGMVYAEGGTRDDMLAAMKKRHTYAATDNIIADYRCTTGGKTYMMGDDVTTSEPPTVTIKLHGTAPFAKVTLVKDDVEHVLGEPNKAEVEFTWTDKEPKAGKESYYYVRGEQTDGELVWASPMWITYKP
ncbi:MAG TPA: hypothetical protein VGI40_02585 [Pirellulaceae bacterium]